MFFPCLNGIKEKERIVSVEFLIHQADEISDNLSGFFFVNPLDRLVAGVGNFSAFSESLILGINSPVVLSFTAASL